MVINIILTMTSILIMFATELKANNHNLWGG